MSAYIILFVLFMHCINSVSYTDIDWQNIDISLELQFDELRSIDGFGNNPDNPNYGIAFGEAQRCVPPAFGDGFNSLAGTDRLNPREISNVLFRSFPEESPAFLSQRDLTQWAWQWGQFIDHDITLMTEDQNTNDFSLDIDIYVPCCDITFDPNCACAANITIEMFRTKAFNNSGTSPSKPRIMVNEITAFLDGSAVYGSDIARANELRSFSKGLMKVSIASNGDELLPLNLNGIGNEPNSEARFYIAGDPRANEQTGLLIMHTLMVRLHNLIAVNVYESVTASLPPLIPASKLDELTYQYTKLLVTAIMQKITYKDYLLTLFGPTAIERFLGDYQGYDKTINPQMCVIFSGSAFRLGHTQLPRNLAKRTPTCNYIPSIINPNTDVELRDSFFVPEMVKDSPETVDDIVHGFSCTKANEIDTRVTEGVRDFLLDSAVDSGGNKLFGILDLVSLNLNRGRDQGIPDFNSVRELIGLPKFTSFSNFSDDAVLNEDIEVLYRRDIDNVDLFAGLLAEKHMEGGSFGETISKIVLEQFKRTRDGDRFWYENYIKPGCLTLWIESITLKDVLEWTINEEITSTDATENVFQNTKAISIFDVPVPPIIYPDTLDVVDELTPLARKPGDAEALNNDSFIVKMISNPVQLLVIGGLIVLFACIFGLIMGNKVAHYKKAKKYQAIAIDTDTQGSSTDVVTDV